MRKAFIITFDYGIMEAAKATAVHNFITTDRNIIGWWHHLKNTYIVIVNGNVTASFLTRAIQQKIGNNYCLIMEITHPNDYDGWLPQEAWDWFNNSLIHIR